MKSALGAALLAVAVCSGLNVPLRAQDVVTNGPWKYFRREQPPLSYEEITTPFIVRAVSGTITYGDGKPLEGASFEIGLRDGVTLSSPTIKDGHFELSSPHLLGPFAWSGAVGPGTYRFKVTKDGFHSTVGTVVVSAKAPKDAVIAIALKPGEGYQEERPREPPNEKLIPLTSTAPVEVPNRKKYPQKYSAVYIPVSLGAGRVRTPEFLVAKQQFYDIMLQVEKPLPSPRMQCMLGTAQGPLDEQYCGSEDPIVRADWTVWEGGSLVHWGSIPNEPGAIYEAKNIFIQIGSFSLEAGKKYVVQVHFTKDGSALNVANPHLIVIPHGDMW